MSRNDRENPAVDLDFDPDDEELEETPPDVIEELGFDPLEADVEKFDPNQPRDEGLDFNRPKELSFRKFRLLKFDDAEHTVGGIVYEPDVADSQGDWTDADEIRKAMYRYMEKSQTIRVMHKGRLIAKPCKVLECFQPDEDTTKAGKPLPKGAWWLTVRVPNQELYDAIKSGEYTGFSMGGVAKEADVEKFDSDQPRDEAGKWSETGAGGEGGGKQWERLRDRVEGTQAEADKEVRRYGKKVLQIRSKIEALKTGMGSITTVQDTVVTELENKLAGIRARKTNLTAKVQAINQRIADLKAKLKKSTEADSMKDLLREEDQLEKYVSEWRSLIGELDKIAMELETK